MAYEYEPGDTFFHHLDPRIKLLTFAIIIGMVVSISDPIWLALLALSVYSWSIVGKVTGKANKMLKSFLPLFIIAYILNIAFAVVPEEPWFYLISLGTWKLFPISPGRLIFAAGIVGRTISTFIGVWLLLLLTPPSLLILGLVKSRVPKDIAMAVGIGMATAPAFIREMRVILEAQRSRAHVIEYRNPIKKLRAIIPVMIPLLWATMRRAESIAISITSRAFTHDPKNRTFRGKLETTRKGWLFNASYLVLLVMVLFIKTYYPFYVSYEFTYSIIKFINSLII